MAVTLTVDANIHIKGFYTKTNDVGGNVEVPILVDTTIAFTSGTTANKADQLWQDQSTLSSTATDALDCGALVAGGAPFGQVLDMHELRGLYVSSASANEGYISIGGNAAAVLLFGAAADYLTVPWGGMVLWTCPADGAIVVVEGTGDKLDIEEKSSVSATYDIMIWGTSA